MSNYNQDALLVFSGYEAGTEFNESQFEITRINGGLINHSWVVRSQNKAPFLLQRINKNVFRKPIAVQENYISIWEFANQNATGLRLPQPVFYKDHQSLYIDTAGHNWRAFEFIENATSPVIASKAAQARSTAESFGQFTATFGNFDTGALQEVIPDFHNLSYRYRQFEQALKMATPERKEKAKQIISALLRRENYKDFYDKVSSSPDHFPKRVMHHDAKIANVLFDKNNGQVICPVDFDTVMPGYYFSDLGDMIRSMACSDDENCTDLERIDIRTEYYDAIVNGYLQVMQPQLKEEEIKNIHFAGILMIYMQALRFLSDYLNGDIYYHIEYPTQNLSRANNQLRLLEKLEAHLKQAKLQSELAYFPEK